MYERSAEFMAGFYQWLAESDRPGQILDEIFGKNFFMEEE